MRLLINTASVLKGGSVQVAASLLSEFKSFSDDEFGVILGPGLSGVVREEVFPKNFRFFRLGYRPAQGVLSLRRTAKDMEEIERAFEPDAVFTTSGPSYWRPMAPHLMGFNLPHHLYQDSPYFTQILNPVQRIRWRLKSTLIHYYTKAFADAWVVQTDDVNHRLRQWIPSKRVYTVSNTISNAYLEAQRMNSQDSNLEAEGNGPFRLLVLSSYYRHKNLEILNDIVGLLREQGIEDIRFTLTLPESDYKKTIFPENRAWIRNVGPIPPEDCPALYQESDGLFLPSLLECFSANYVEAMAMGCPIVTTDLGFARTTCSEAALYFAPLNAEDALRKILHLKDNAKLRESLTSKGRTHLRRFGTARERARAYIDLCRILVECRLSSER